MFWIALRFYILFKKKSNSFFPQWNNELDSCFPTYLQQLEIVSYSLFSQYKQNQIWTWIWTLRFIRMPTTKKKINLNIVLRIEQY